MLNHLVVLRDPQSIVIMQNQHHYVRKIFVVQTKNFQ